MNSSLCPSGGEKKFSCCYGESNHIPDVYASIW